MRRSTSAWPAASRRPARRSTSSRPSRRSPGGRWWSVPTRGRTRRPPVATGPGAEHGLTARESEVLALIAQGLSNKEVAERAFVSLNTVKTFIRSAYRKIGVERAQPGRALGGAQRLRAGPLPRAARPLRVGPAAPDRTGRPQQVANSTGPLSSAERQRVAEPSTGPEPQHHRWAVGAGGDQAQGVAEAAAAPRGRPDGEPGPRPEVLPGLARVSNSATTLSEPVGVQRHRQAGQRVSLPACATRSWRPGWSSSGLRTSPGRCRRSRGPTPSPAAGSVRERDDAPARRSPPRRAVRAVAAPRPRRPGA